VYFKCENLQVTGSFKLRGALNKISELVGTTGDRLRGVVTASSGNHGQAVAYAAKMFGVPCTVVVPEGIPKVKETGILRFGASIVRRGQMSAERIALAQQLALEQGSQYIPPYDDPLIVAGQGTVGLEILDQCPTVGTVIVPVGGGGLLSGIATAIKNVQPSVQVVGAEPEAANDTYLSLQRGRICAIASANTVADGLRTSQPGDFTFPIIRRFVDDVVLVSEQGILQALQNVLNDSKILVEPSGAVSVAALSAADVSSGPIVCVLSGGNVDLSNLASWL
jgi:threonine dehydratase